jgi:hypothetical protein
LGLKGLVVVVVVVVDIYLNLLWCYNTAVQL